MSRYTVNELRSRLDNSIKNGYGDLEVKVTGTDFKIITSDDINGIDGVYNEDEIRNAVSKVTEYYKKMYDKMSFAEITIVEHMLIHFEAVLFCGEVGTIFKDYSKGE